MYEADQETRGRNELFAARLDGSGGVKLNAPLLPGGNVNEPGNHFYPAFVVAPDRTCVLYMARANTGGALELYRSPLP